MSQFEQDNSRGQSLYLSVNEQGKMGRKEISVDIRNLIVKLRNEGKSYNQISKTVCKSRSTVQTVIKNVTVNGSVLNKRRTGRPKLLNDRDVRSVLRKVKIIP